MDEHELAVSSFKTALSIFENEATYLQLGKSYVNLNETEEAINAYNEALKFSPDNCELLTSIGILLVKLGSNEEALENFNKVAKIDNMFSDAMLGIATLNQEEENYEAAMLAYRLTTLRNPNNSFVWNNLGLMFFAQKKYVTVI